MNTPDFQLALLKVPVSEIERSTAFYRDVLGLEVLFSAEEYGWAQLRAGDLALALYRPGMGGGDGALGGSLDFHLALPGAAFDTLASGLQERGLLVDDQVQRGDDGTVFFELLDPDRNGLKVLRGAED